MYNTYNIGPSTDPWGTPHRAPLLHDVAPFTLKGKKAGTKVCQRRTLAFHSNWQQFCLPKTSLRSLYYSLVYPCLTYCVSVWGSTYQSNLNRIIILQKKIIRIISKVSFDAHTGVLFKEQEILKFSDIYLYQMVNLYIFLKEAYLLIIFVICLLLQARYILIIQEIPAFSIYLIVEIIFENSQFGFRVLSFSTR